ncbi:carboxypeptidase regulatory-like domain-containing protein, partial [bacterium]
LFGFVKKGNQKESFGQSVEYKARIAGRILDPDGKPVEGIRVHAYDHVQMSERPKFVSAKTGPDGRYELNLPEGGTYYLCARDKYGGPPKVGDLFGRFDKGTVEPSGVTLSDGENRSDIDIAVHTVW